MSLSLEELYCIAVTEDDVDVARSHTQQNTAQGKYDSCEAANRQSEFLVQKNGLLFSYGGSLVRFVLWSHTFEYSKGGDGCSFIQRLLRRVVHRISGTGNQREGKIHIHGLL